MLKNQKQLLSFIHTLANMPARSQAVCALLVSSASLSATHREVIIQEVKKHPNVSFIENGNLATLVETMRKNSLEQTIKNPCPVVCLITETEMAENDFDQFSPLVFSLDSSDKKPGHD